MLKQISNISCFWSQNTPVHYNPSFPDNMRYSMVIHKGKRYVTHTSLHHSESALITLTTNHFLIIFLLILLLYTVFAIWGFTVLAIVFLSLITFLYFSDLFFNLFLIIRSFTKRSEIVITKEEINSYEKYDWPMYTIFCPLYKEASILPQFVDSIKNIDYPKEKLEVLLLLEEDDMQTIETAQKMDLPEYFKILIVPHSFPKTKPKAVNYGLSMASGKYAVIFDAEDIPDPDQLKKSVIAFNKVDKKVICLQAKLNFYNTKQNLLTRLFTAEYSMWFDLILPGLQSINAPIPLGGTSNHFIVDKLNELKGWDPFNVTEDCDLGIRIWRKRYKTEIFDSTTWEEANSKIGNWFRQRSRWIKGYIQTFLVHYKKPLTFILENFNMHIFSFNLVVLGKVVSIFINPFMWLITILYFIFRSQIGEQIEQIFPPFIYYIALISLILGNFLYIYCMVLGLAKREYWDLIPFFVLIPIYWLMMSMAAWIALYQLIIKPHYWEKTIHGLHLNKKLKINHNFDFKKPNYNI